MHHHHHHGGMPEDETNITTITVCTSTVLVVVTVRWWWWLCWKPRPYVRVHRHHHHYHKHGIYEYSSGGSGSGGGGGGDGGGGGGGHGTIVVLVAVVAVVMYILPHRFIFLVPDVYFSAAAELVSHHHTKPITTTPTIIWAVRTGMTPASVLARYVHVRRLWWCWWRWSFYFILSSTTAVRLVYTSHVRTILWPYVYFRDET